MAAPRVAAPHGPGPGPRMAAPHGAAPRIAPPAARQPSQRQHSSGHLEQCRFSTRDWLPVRIFECDVPPARLPFVRPSPFPNASSGGGECCRSGSASQSWRAPARCRSCARSDHPARSPELRTHVRRGREFYSGCGLLSLARPTAGGCERRQIVAGAGYAARAAYCARTTIAPMTLWSPLVAFGEVGLPP
jgi:hypothetical protein